MTKRSTRRPLDGVLLIDKPFGFSSNGALQKARWLLNAAKAGHTGVLDPFATGLLPLCFGEATKFAQVLLDADKAYRATICLGKVSTTLDGEGEVTETGGTLPSLSEVKAVLSRLSGDILQVPPMHSALKHEGKALYEYARAGQEIERPARQVTIYRIDLVSFDGNSLVLDVACSKGTYIRVLAADIGQALGCGAYLTGLIRSRTAGFSLDNAISLESLEAMPPEERASLLKPVDCLIEDFPQLTLDEQDTRLLRNGMVVQPEEIHGILGSCRVYGVIADSAPRFIGLGEVGKDGKLRAKRMLATAD